MAKWRVTAEVRLAVTQVVMAESSGQAVLVAGLGGVVPGWVYAIPEESGYRWATGESRRVQA